MQSKFKPALSATSPLPLTTQSVKVRRIVDKESGNIVYVSYSQRLSQDANDKGRFKSSLCAVHMAE